MNKVFIPAPIFQSKEATDALLKDARLSGADRIFLCLGDVGRMPFEKGEFRTRIIDTFKEKIKYVKENGFEAGVWVGTLGFGTPTAHYNKDVAKKYTRIRSISGRVADDALCPLDEAFAEMTCEIIKELAQTGTDMIMLDDELCMSVRPGIGCACDLHLKKFREAVGENVSPEDLGYRIFSGKPNKYRDAWLTLMGDTLRHFCAKLRQAVDSVAPTVRLGFCAGYTSWDMEGADAIELTKILAGNTKPFLRLTGAPYWIAARRFGRQTLQTVIETARMQYAWCKDSGIEIFTESDTYPRDRFHTPAAYSECFHLATLASDGADTLKYMYDYMCEPDFERGYVDAHIRNINLQKQITEFFANKAPLGIRVYQTMRKLQSADLGDCLFNEGELAPHDKEKLLMKQYMFPASQMLLTSNAIPTVYDGEGTCGIAFGENARALPKSAFNKGLILDVKAAKILTERGIDVGLESCERISGSFMELFLGESPDTDLFDTQHLYKAKLKSGTKIISRFKCGEFFSNNTYPLAYLYENADRQRFLVYAFDAEEQTDSSSLYWSYGRGKQIANALEWLGGEALPLRCERHPHLYAICKKGDKSVSAAYFNLCADEIVCANVTLAKEAKSIRFVNCTGRLTDKLSAVIDYIKPYGVAVIDVKY